MSKTEDVTQDDQRRKYAARTPEEYAAHWLHEHCVEEASDLLDMYAVDLREDADAFEQIACSVGTIPPDLLTKFAGAFRVVHIEYDDVNPLLADGFASHIVDEGCRNATEFCHRFIELASRLPNTPWQSMLKDGDDLPS